MRKLTYLGILALVLSLPFVLSAAAPPLVNPSFEGGWHEQGAGELTLPDGWTLEYRDGDHPWCPSPCHRPEVKPNEEYVYDGRFSMRTFTTFSRGLYGVYQQVSVTPGAWYTFSCQVRIDSNPPGELAAFVGIQPWGGGLFDRQMIWGKETQTQLSWQTVSVTAQAYGDRIRVAMGANNKWPTRGNTLWWDACTLTEASPSAPTPTPYPTYTPYPTPVVTPCPTCAPGGECDYDEIGNVLERVLRGLRWGVE